MGIEAVGKLHTIFDTKQVSDRFSKREFVVELADQKYPQTVLFQVTGDRCSQLDNFQVGDQVRVEFSLRGREWRSPSGEIKYFNSLDVWRVESASAQRTASGSGPNRRNGGDYGGRGGDPRDRDVPAAPAGRMDEMYGTPARGTDDDIPF
jgi:single-stranded DNA-binding protein|nr:DUF3127 domain-containing protein [Kofleriaceae bacterium]